MQTDRRQTRRQINTQTDVEIDRRQASRKIICTDRFADRVETDSSKQIICK